MRGEDQSQAGMFSHISHEQRVPKDHPLRAIRVINSGDILTISGRSVSRRAKEGVHENKYCVPGMCPQNFRVNSKIMTGSRTLTGIHLRTYCMNLDDALVFLEQINRHNSGLRVCCAQLSG